jgi:hypothetical protein
MQKLKNRPTAKSKHCPFSFMLLRLAISILAFLSPFVSSAAYGNFTIISNGTLLTTFCPVGKDPKDDFYTNCTETMYNNFNVTSYKKGNPITLFVYANYTDKSNNNQRKRFSTQFFPVVDRFSKITIPRIVNGEDLMVKPNLKLGAFVIFNQTAVVGPINTTSNSVDERGWYTTETTTEAPVAVPYRSLIITLSGGKLKRP